MKPQARVAAPLAVLTGALMLWSTTGVMSDVPAQSCDVSLYPLSTPTTRFTDNGDGTVTDLESKLMWMRCAVGQTWTNATCIGTAATLSWEGAREAAWAINTRGTFFFNDWRLPQVRELAGIAERQCKNPRINLTAFPGTPPAAFWTATSRPATGSEAFAFVLGFAADGIHYVSKEETHDVRLVRTTP